MDVGELRLGVRCTSPTILATLARRLSPYLVDDPNVPPNYSLEVFEGSATRKRHRLYEANTLALRSRDPAALVRAIDTMLAVYETTANGPIALSSLAAMGSGGAVLIPDGKQLRATAGTSGSPLSHPIWAGPVILDSRTTELVLPTLERAKTPIAGDPADGDVAIASPGGYQLRAVCYVGRGATEIERIDGTDAVYAITQLLPLDSAQSARRSIDVARKLASSGVTVMAAPPSALNELLTS